ncbi:L-2-hydroxyglutarate oxidase LhgO [Aminobacter aminovorans]|uniref:L-2-hydroxyglutarate oxidase LhgO n=1 Tax=Aminobacter aminovorans TaxID=83263 RepID=A0A380WGQ3_AMIAI|nr:NAD(P)/FAD-dependent oxidoreductase [Aminobacter aminovorans]TCS23448.1 L-2-hydroxyglutarate oxidase LhgO [Aminobacter aminovorans]SUU87324.1 L-2-hydroxyglutarate oxidase LhgO [Aminobacter aminovorans]
METVDCIIAGAGVIGLAVARELSRLGMETIVVEAADAIGTETSSRNSEVIHAGIYYPPGSLKAELCVAGRDKLYAYAAERGVPHKRCGKLIVATLAEQVSTLKGIVDQARANGVDDLVLLDAAGARAMEPSLACHAAVLSPSTGIVDSHALMLSLLGEAEGHGTMLSLNTEIVSGRLEAGRFVLQTLDSSNGMSFEITARHFVNAAGLGANRLAASLDGLDPRFVPELRYARGNYFSVTGKPAFSRLIYPVPEPGGLGIHLTLDLNGAMRFGPDVEWIETKDYSVDPCRADHFYGEIRKYWPALADDSLSPTYSGIRPKLAGPGELVADFVIQGPEVHGVVGLVNLFGIESPGLTSSLAIAELVAEKLKRTYV